MSNLPVRKSMRLKDYDYSQAGSYFITVCAYERKEIFGNINVGAIHESPDICRLPQINLSPAGKVVESVISNIPLRYSVTNVDKYVIMPNHIHMIIALYEERAIHESPLRNGKRSLILQIVGYLKMNVTKQIREQKGGIYNVWQRSYYDHIIRNEKDYRRIWQYSELNLNRSKTNFCFG